jgi:hypothetical protein
MTDLQVAQPVFTLVLHSMFRLRATALPAIVGQGMGHSRLVAQHSLDERKNRSKQEIRADESNDAA